LPDVSIAKKAIDPNGTLAASVVAAGRAVLTTLFMPAIDGKHALTLPSAFEVSVDGASNQLRNWRAGLGGEPFQRLFLCGVQKNIHSDFRHSFHLPITFRDSSHKSAATAKVKFALICALRLMLSRSPS
jgi:hypothetical protein